MLHTIQDDEATLGVAPSAAAALRSKRSLAENTLSSSRAILDGVVQIGLAEKSDVARAIDAVERLEVLLIGASRPGDVVEPVFYEWYFRAIEHYKSGDFKQLAWLAPAVSAVAALPILRGSAASRTECAFEVDLLEDGRLILSERASPDGSAPRVGARARLSSQDRILHVAGTEGRASLDWRALDAFGRYAVPGSPIQFWQAGHTLERIIAAYQRDLSSIYEDPEPFQLVAPGEFEHEGLYDVFAERFRGGLSLIEACWPDLYDETCVLTDYFTLIKGNPFIGGSAISCLGVSFFKLLPDWSDVCFADHIVHEAAHQRLHVEFEVEPALANGDFTAVISPIRRDPRPLYGVLHATFVFLRLSLFFERVLAVRPSPEAEQRFHRHVLGLYRGIEQLQRYAHWNPRGQKLYDHICRQADRLKTILPHPRAELYDKLGPDYEPVSALAAAYHD
ncbi:aKG-HExxH-type peptide beta-hydroxylase [Methylobacterium oryzisoli]|uniref:aKG-HExxH-type peptide beta-hydroxylase n=1 Tax=Methylobacterium oryzisoli TaxID=3385502 RepID=UPI003891A810